MRSKKGLLGTEVCQKQKMDLKITQLLNPINESGDTIAACVRKDSPKIFCDIIFLVLNILLIVRSGKRGRVRTGEGTERND